MFILVPSRPFSSITALFEATIIVQHEVMRRVFQG